MPELPEVHEMIRRLVATPSVSSADPALDRSNRPVVELLADWAEGLGFRCEQVDVPGAASKTNLIATLGEGDGGLVLSGHTDTVPFDEGRWRTDPFVATERDGRIHGLGTADMKSFLALALTAAARVDAAKLIEPLILLATADEECGMDGARALVAAGRPRARRAVIGEPTDLKPVRMHKGVMMERIRLVGRSGHSSNPSLGASALEGMRHVLNGLVALREELQSRYREPAFDVPEPTMNLGQIAGGDAPNRICAECTLHVDVRLLPGMEPEEVRSAIRERVRSAVDASGIALELDTDGLFEAVPPFETPADAGLVRAASELTGHAPVAVAFGTEGPFLSGLGMETIVMGPGSIDVAHQPDEYLPVASIDPTIDLLERLVQRYCVAGDGS